MNAKQLTEEEAAEWRTKLQARSRVHAEYAQAHEEKAKEYRKDLEASRARPPIAENRFAVSQWETAIQYEFAIAKAHREAARGTAEEARAL